MFVCRTVWLNILIVAVYAGIFVRESVNAGPFASGGNMFAVRRWARVCVCVCV
jgi:hypothetical protein